VMIESIRATTSLTSIIETLGKTGTSLSCNCRFSSRVTPPMDAMNVAGASSSTPG